MAKVTSRSNHTDAISIKRGVLQGGVLSPFLFNTYINDLSQSLKNINAKFYLYADDLAVLVHGQKKANDVITSVLQWCKKNKMQINAKKCGVMFLGGTRKLTVAEKAQKTLMDIPIVNCYKYLGVNIWKNLRPPTKDPLVTDKLSRYRKMLFILRKNRAPPYVMQTNCKAFPCSSLLYGGFLHDKPFSSASHKKATESLYNQSLKLAFGLRKNTAAKLLRKHLPFPTF